MPTDCTACGTCCFSRLATYVPVLGADYERLGTAVDELVVFDGHRAHMRMANGSCAALRLESGRFLCLVYEQRPLTCRTLLRDSLECAGEIEAKGERPLVALRASGLGSRIR